MLKHRRDLAAAKAALLEIYEKQSGKHACHILQSVYSDGLLLGQFLFVKDIGWRESSGELRLETQCQEHYALHTVADKVIEIKTQVSIEDKQQANRISDQLVSQCKQGLFSYVMICFYYAEQAKLAVSRKVLKWTRSIYEQAELTQFYQDVGHCLSADIGVSDWCLVSFTDDVLSFIAGQDYESVYKDLHYSLRDCYGHPVAAAIQSKEIQNVNASVCRHLSPDFSIGKTSEGKGLCAVPIALTKDIMGALVVLSKDSEALSLLDVDVINELAQSTALVIRQKQLESTVYKLAHFDQLTGLYNRISFNQKVNAILKQPFLEEYKMLFLDLDGFKDINDSFGHAAGDLFLIQFAQRLKQLVRNDDVIGRFGGDEFAILVREEQSGMAEKIAERIVGNLRQFPLLLDDGQQILGSVSIGISKLRFSIDEAMKEADNAMYAAKRAGKNTYRMQK